MKKVLSLGLALAICLALAIPVFASTANFQTENESLTPTIEVDMPASAGVILNPYGMTYTGTRVANGTSSDKQIISNLFYITNKTKGAKVEVATTVTGVSTGNAQLVAKDDSGLVDDSSNTVIGKKFTTGDNGEKGNKVVLALSYNATGALSAPPTTLSGDGVFTADKVAIITGNDVTLAPIVLAPASDTGTDYSYVKYQFSGIAVSKPETAWSDRDTVGAKFVYTFTATPDAVSSGS